jgi:hypothetical protein
MYTQKSFTMLTNVRPLSQSTNAYPGAPKAGSPIISPWLPHVYEEASKRYNCGECRSRHHKIARIVRPCRVCKIRPCRLPNRPKKTSAREIVILRMLTFTAQQVQRITQYKSNFGIISTRCKIYSKPLLNLWCRQLLLAWFSTRDKMDERR